MISNPLDVLIKEMGFEIGASKQINDVKAPMPGLVLSIKAKVGDEIQKGDAILILEAMKMENVLKAQGNGIIKAIKINEGEAVEKNQVLIELE